MKRSYRWLFAVFVILVIALGWKYPSLGFVVPVVMITGMVTGLFKGRFACGNLCPRGAFFEKLFGWRKGHVPEWMRSIPLRLILFAGLMGFMAFNLSRNLGDPLHWGYVFWLMCSLTTAVGVMLALAIHPYAWCAVCPVGTTAHLLGKGKAGPFIDIDKCTNCGICEKSCRMEIAIRCFKDNGRVLAGDCTACGDCVRVCPVKALKKSDS